MHEWSPIVRRVSVFAHESITVSNPTLRSLPSTSYLKKKRIYQISGITLACVRTHTFTVTRTVVQVVTVKPRTVLSSPTRITETYGTYAISIMETAVWAVDDYQDRKRLLTCQ